MSRKLLAILSALIIAASLCACNENGEEETSENNTIDIVDSTNDETEAPTDDTETGETSPEVDPPVVDDDYLNAEYTDHQDTVYIIHPNGAVLLHADEGNTDTSLPNGSELKRIAISEESGWSKVVYEENTYYVVTKCLTTLSDLDEGFVEVEKTLELAVTSLNVRNTPSMDNHVVGYLTEGNPVKIIAENTVTGWYKVEFIAYGGTVAEGYVVSDAQYYKTAEGESGDNTAAETFTVGSMSLTLTNDFESENIEGFTATYVDNQNAVGVFIIQEKFSLLEGFGDWSLDQYALALKSNVQASEISETKTENGITYFEYEFKNTDLNLTYYYYTTVFKDTDCFWTVQFTCLAEDKEDTKTAFAEYAKSITFAQ